MGAGEFAGGGRRDQCTGQNGELVAAYLVCALVSLVSLARAAIGTITMSTKGVFSGSRQQATWVTQQLSWFLPATKAVLLNHEATLQSPAREIFPKSLDGHSSIT